MAGSLRLSAKCLKRLGDGGHAGVRANRSRRANSGPYARLPILDEKFRPSPLARKVLGCLRKLALGRLLGLSIAKRVGQTRVAVKMGSLSHNLARLLIERAAMRIQAKFRPSGAADLTDYCL